MLFSLRSLSNHAIQATDGEIGRIESFYFDDESRFIRYVVAEPGQWFDRTKVLLSPYSIRAVDDATRRVEVNLTRQQVASSPDIDTESPITRQMEVDCFTHYRWPFYWTGAGVWGAAAPLGSDFELPPASNATAQGQELPDCVKSQVYLRSLSSALGCHVFANKGELGHLDDFIVDDQGWMIRYFVVRFRKLIASHLLLIARDWVNSIHWKSRKIRIALPKEKVIHSPPFDASVPISREYEELLHRYYEKQGYWEKKLFIRSNSAA